MRSRPASSNPPLTRRFFQFQWKGSRTSSCWGYPGGPSGPGSAAQSRRAKSKTRQCRLFSALSLLFFICMSPCPSLLLRYYLLHGYSLLSCYVSVIWLVRPGLCRPSGRRAWRSFSGLGKFDIHRNRGGRLLFRVAGAGFLVGILTGEEIRGDNDDEFSLLLI